MGEATIRRVTAADGAAFRSIRLEMLADAPLAFVTTLAEVAGHRHDEYAGRCARAATGTQYAQFVAEVDRRLIGHAGGFGLPGDTETTMLYSVYVSRSHRGTGVLADLIEAVGAWSRQSGRARLELEVVTTNERAVRAYQKLGFVAVGEPLVHPTVPTMREQRMARTA
jgi:GNAT superfamily N-acetyltransferase